MKCFNIKIGREERMKGEFLNLADISICWMHLAESFPNITFRTLESLGKWSHFRKNTFLFGFFTRTPSSFWTSKNYFRFCIDLNYWTFDSRLVWKSQSDRWKSANWSIFHTSKTFEWLYASMVPLTRKIMT